MHLVPSITDTRRTFFVIGSNYDAMEIGSGGGGYEDAECNGGRVIRYSGLFSSWLMALVEQLERIDSIRPDPEQTCSSLLRHPLIVFPYYPCTISNR